MCWNFEVSIITGITSYTIAAYLWARNFRNDRWHAITLFTVSTIQFLEAIIWYMHNNGSDTSMITWSVIALLIPLVLALEPIATMFGAQYVGKKVSDADKILYVCVFLILLVTLSRNNSFPNIFVDGHIRYQKTETNKSLCYWIFALLLVYPFMKYGEFSNFYIIVGIFLALALSASLYTKSPGSVWCLYGNIIAGFFLFYPFMV
jgi:hypothetical protein